MKNSKILKVLYYKGDLEPTVIQIEETLENMQKLVGGLVEYFYFQDFIFGVNEEGKMRNLPQYWMLRCNETYAISIYGDFFVMGVSKDENGFKSLSKNMRRSITSQIIRSTHENYGPFIESLRITRHTYKINLKGESV